MTESASGSDHALQAAVSEELEWVPDVDASRIGVTAHDGVVTLYGTVRTMAERLAAKRSALRVHGVSAVADELSVERTNATPSDTAIATAVRDVLASTAGIPRDSVKASVTNGVVVLTGTVDWHTQRETARKLASGVTGVGFVDSRIALTDRPSAPDTAKRIRDALIRNATVDADTIRVAVEGTEVVLTGTVKSWAERRQAVEAAWSSPHVSAVRDELIVSVG